MSKLRKQLSKELEQLEGLEKLVLSGKNEGFTCFKFKGKEIAHFDNNNEFDLRLTKSMINKEQLAHPGTSKNHPNRKNSDWIVLQFRKEEKIKEIVRLVKLAIAQVPS